MGIIYVLDYTVKVKKSLQQVVECFFEEDKQHFINKYEDLRKNNKAQNIVTYAI